MGPNVGRDTKPERGGTPGKLRVEAAKQPKGASETSRKKAKDTFSGGGTKWEDLELKMTDEKGNYKTPW